MKCVATITATLTIGLSATAALSEDYQVERSLQISAPPAMVWQRVGDFCDIDDWHPALSGCALRVIDGSLHRVLMTEEGEEIVQRRIAAEPGLSYTYRVVSSPLAFERYTATFSISPTDGSTINWSVRFASDDPSVEGEVAEMMDAGFAAIESEFE